MIEPVNPELVVPDQVTTALGLPYDEKNRDKSS